MFSAILAMMHRPYSFFVLAAVIAALLCLFPVRVDAPGENEMLAQDPSPLPYAQVSSAPVASAAPVAPVAPAAQAGADLTERTGENALLHKTLYYAPCGHSVQHRQALPAQLKGLSRKALDEAIGGVLPGAQVTGFSGSEVDVTIRMEIPCPLHWVLQSGEDSMLAVYQNRTGDGLELVRSTDVPLSRVPQEDEQQIAAGMVFDDVQALEGYLESLSS